ncbi:MAG: bifunctional oligoribonuclease/PAP phosphatase NrnA [Planctomycetaceae bacterium]|nr:bifunctional oligoribonuclease/PAP phosphatase NrnA [Planctomycetaceae bacterium]
MSVAWGELESLIAQHQTYVLSSHVRPDADALGSELAMASLLLSRGKQVRIINPGSTPAHLKFLDPQNQVQAIHEQPGLVQAIKECEIHLILDTSAWAQLAEVGKVMAAAPSRKVVIDHHVSSDDLNACEFKDIASPATGCLVYEFMEFLGYEPSPWEAECLYTAIATDTGWFRFPATTPDTMRIVGKLMSAGVAPATMYRMLYEQTSLARLHLSGIAMQRAATACAGKLAYTYVTQADFAQTKAHPADTENLVNECMRIKDVIAAFILVEQPNRVFKASLRSREQFDVTPIAEIFGGGGHRQASGATVPGPLEQALVKLVELFNERLTNTP